MGQGASILLGQWGEVGLANGDEPLVLTVPRGIARWLRQRLDDAIVRGPEAGLSMDGSARVRLRSGTWWRCGSAGWTRASPTGMLPTCDERWFSRLRSCQ